MDRDAMIARMRWMSRGRSPTSRTRMAVMEFPLTATHMPRAGGTRSKRAANLPGCPRLGNRCGERLLQGRGAGRVLGGLAPCTREDRFPCALQGRRVMGTILHRGVAETTFETAGKSRPRCMPRAVFPGAALQERVHVPEGHEGWHCPPKSLRIWLARKRRTDRVRTFDPEKQEKSECLCGTGS
jgi:hypothetical protein